MTLAAGLLSLAAFADDVYTIVRTPKAGEKHTYAMSFEAKTMMGGGETTIVVTGLSDSTIDSVAADGTMSETSRSYQTKVSVNGGEQDQPETSSTSKIAADGTLLEHKGEMDGPYNYRRHYIQWLYLPSGPVKVGSTWEKQIPSNTNGTRKTEAKFTLEGVETVNGVVSYKIKCSSKEVEGENPASFEGTNWIATSDGNLVKTEGTVTNYPLPEQMPQDISGKITLNLKS